MINEHVSEWLGYTVKDYTPEDTGSPIEDAAQVIYRLSIGYDDEISFPELFVHFIANVSVVQTPAIIIGSWTGDDSSADSQAIVEHLVGAREQLVSLKGIFIGDILSEENEISWIQQTDVSPLLLAYPNLEHLRIRGSTNLTLGGNLRHESLKSLTIESGGLDTGIIEEVFSLDLPNLEHLELWLGTPNYGGEATVADLQPLLDGKLFPKLAYLGLRDSEIADDIAAALASAPIVTRIEALDLSLGTLSDKGAAALMTSPAICLLNPLDLHHHYLSDEMMARLQAWNPHVNLNEQEDGGEEGEDRYVAVSE